MERLYQAIESSIFCAAACRDRESETNLRGDFLHGDQTESRRVPAANLGCLRNLFPIGGEGEIRTRKSFRLHAFQACAIPLGDFSSFTLFNTSLDNFGISQENCSVGCV